MSEDSEYFAKIMRDIIIAGNRFEVYLFKDEFGEYVELLKETNSGNFSYKFVIENGQAKLDLQ